MDAQLRNKKVLIIEGSTSDGTYYNFLNTIEAFGLKNNESITVKMILKTGDHFNNDQIKITKR